MEKSCPFLSELRKLDTICRNGFSSILCMLCKSILRMDHRPKCKWNLNYIKLLEQNIRKGKSSWFSTKISKTWIYKCKNWKVSFLRWKINSALENIHLRGWKYTHFAGRSLIYFCGFPLVFPTSKYCSITGLSLCAVTLLMMSPFHILNTKA